MFDDLTDDPAERKVYTVACSAALLDFRKASVEHVDLLHPSDYAFCQSVGARIHREGPRSSDTLCSQARW